MIQITLDFGGRGLAGFAVSCVCSGRDAWRSRACQKNQSSWPITKTELKATKARIVFAIVRPRSSRGRSAGRQRMAMASQQRQEATRTAT